MNIKKLKILLVSCLLAFSVANAHAKTVGFSTFYGIHEVQDSVFNLDNSIFNQRGFSIFDNFLPFTSIPEAQPELISAGVTASDQCYFGSLYLIICSSGVLPGTSGDDELPGTGGDGDDPILDGAAVPLPAAAWLFGSALIGLFGAGRRKA